MSRKLREEHDCLNCGAQVQGEYCSSCGQRNIVPRESFSHIMKHFITDYLHIDEKLFSSLRPLLFKPGFLTNQYNAGRRTAFVHPFRLYIFISIFYFLFSSIASHRDEKIKDSFVKIDSLSLKEREVIDTLTSRKKKNKSSNEEDFNIVFEEENLRKSDTSVEAYRARQAGLHDSLKDGWITRLLNERNIRAKQKGYNITQKTNENFAKNIPKMIFMLLPVFAWILYLLFRKEKLYYVEHFYHSVHLHSFLFLFLSFMLFIKWPLPEEIADYLNLVILIVVPIYLYRSCITVYKEHGASTLMKLIVAAIGYIVFLLIFTVINAAISFMII